MAGPLLLPLIAHGWLAAPRAPPLPAMCSRRGGAAVMVDAFVLDRLREMRKVHDELGAQLEDPAVQANVEEMLRVSRERSKLDSTVEALAEWESLEQRLEEGKELFNEEDAELREMARAEIREVEEAMEALDGRLKLLLLPTGARGGDGSATLVPPHVFF
jgi:peptide chain release factor 1